ncbi:MAG: 3-oxoacid CoA-transferase subunit A [Dehalococcoidia bacterium]|nr:3-oxoacid CoA-transferase subunit A [Dehalococcoidia bacterium]
MASKVFRSAGDAVADIPHGAVVMLGGFGGPGGMAHNLVLALKDQGAGDLTVISNTAGIARVANFGTPSGFTAIDHSILVENGQIRKAVASFPVSPSPSRPSPFEEAYRAGKAELELVPQGTLAERIRAGGLGVAGFYTPTGAGTPIAEGKETRVFDGREYVLERALRADYALLRAHKADTLGNLVYRGTSRNFNATMAPAADVTIVEVDEVVQPGHLDPEAVVTPCPFVQRIVVRPPGFVPYTRDPRRV